jgi:hypothetical protein
MRVEAEQRRSIGFETKRPLTIQVTSAVATSAGVPDGLDWQSFSAAYFPLRRRHDLEALTAYGAYRRSHEVDARSSDEPARIEAVRGQAGSTAVQDWEDEGGAAF